MTIQKINERLATCKEVFWQWGKYRDGKFPIKIRVTYNRQSEYFPAQVDGEKIMLTEKEWEAIVVRGQETKEIVGLNTKLRGDNRKIVNAITACLAEARKSISLATDNGRKQFTFTNFKKHFVQKAITSGFIESFESYIQDLLKDGRVGTYVAYKNALSAFKAFRNDRELSPAEITVTLLKDFDAYLRKKKTITTATGKKVTRSAGSTTVSMYMRALKVVYNLLADANPDLKQEYPFATKQNDRIRYHIPAASGSHKGEALSPETLRQFIDVKTEAGTPEHEAKLYFLFSLFCQGINMRDIASLRYRDIDSNAIRFVREKTKRTVARKTVIEVPMTPMIESIILELSTKDKFAENFVFPIISADMDAVAQDKAIRQKIKVTNKWIAFLCKQANLPEFTTYSARHSFATMLKQSGVSNEIIKEMLGHRDLRTTENYLKRFEIEKMREANNNIYKTLKIA